MKVKQASAGSPAESAKMAHAGQPAIAGTSSTRMA